MKILMIIIMALSLSGCATVQDKDFWMWTGSVLVIGAIAAHQADNGGGNVAEPTCAAGTGRVVTAADGGLLCVLPASGP